MGSTILGVVLDSSTLIDAERKRLNVGEFLRHLVDKLGESEAAVSAITVAELVHGIYRADTQERGARRRAFLDDLKAAVPVYPITEATAELAGRISGESSARGLNIPLDDLLIGACALERGYAVATRNMRHFQMIPGLEVKQL